MSDLTITVAEVRPPQPGKQKGMVKDVSGKYWLVWPKDLGAFVVGSTHRITDYESWTSQQGRTYYTIKAFQTVVGGQQAPSGGAPRPAAQDDSLRRMDIFVCGAFNNLLSNTNINPRELKMMDMVDILNDLRGAWLGVFGPSPLPRKPIPRPADPISTSPQRNDDLNDDIPF